MSLELMPIRVSGGIGHPRDAELEALRLAPLSLVRYVQAVFLPEGKSLEQVEAQLRHMFTPDESDAELKARLDEMLAGTARCSRQE